MTTRTLSFFLIALTGTSAVLTACTPRPQPAPPSPPTAAKPANSGRPAEAPSLGGLLAGEREGRLPAAPTVEQVAMALQRAGVSLAPMKQVLARTVGARYCAASTTNAGLAIAVCEFAGDADAERGLAFSRRTFDGLIPGRSLTRNRTTVLTLTPASSNADARAQAQDVSKTFATL